VMFYDYQDIKNMLTESQIKNDFPLSQLR